jgi:integrase
MAIFQRCEGGAWAADFRYRTKEGRIIRFRRTMGPEVISKRQALKIERKWRQLMAMYGTIDAIEIEEIENPSSFKEPESEPEPEQESVPFSGFADLWMKNYVKPNNKPSEVQNKKSIIKNHLYPFFGDQDIKAITTEQIEQFVGKKVAAKYSKKSVNLYLTVLRTMLTKAVDWDYLDKSPMNRIKLLRVDPRDPDFYTEEEMQALLKGIKDEFPEHYPFFLTAFSTGMRHGELRALEWTDIEFSTSMIRVRRNKWRHSTGSPKGRRARNIPMHPFLLETLRAQREERPKTKYVFSLPDGSQYGINAGRKAMQKVCEKIGLRRLRLHDIRHTFASLLCMKGQPLRVVQELLGHSDIKTTEIYAHLSPGFSAQSVACLNFKNEENCGHILVTSK